MTPNPSRGTSGSAIPSAATDDPGDLEHRLGPREDLGADVLGDVALDDRVGAELDDLCAEAGAQAEDEQGHERVGDGGRERRRDDERGRPPRRSGRAAAGAGRCRRRSRARCPHRQHRRRGRARRSRCSPAIGCSRMRNAMKRVRNPVSSRAPMALTRAARTVTGRASTRARSRSRTRLIARSGRPPDSGGGVERAPSGRWRRTRVLDVELADRGVHPSREAGWRARCRRHRSTNASRSDQSGPMRDDRACEPTADGHGRDPARAMRELALTRVKPVATGAGSRPNASRRRPWRRRGSPVRRGRATVSRWRPLRPGPSRGRRAGRGSSRWPSGARAGSGRAAAR